ncbi:MAG: ATP-grasp domain-containing protein [Actinomycetota bacterium]|nr:ATP-grasp domain-containing protein [Actinomycetota bacterium]
MTTAAGKNDPLVLLIGTGRQAFREYLLASIASRYRVHLLCGAEPGWPRGYLDGWTVLDMDDTIDAAPMCAAAAELAARETVQGVLSWDEARILQAAKVAAALGLPGGDPDMVLRCRDKHLTRQALDAGGVPQPRSVLVADASQAAEVAGQVGYPVVLKPRAMGGSLGVIRADTPAELAARFEFARDTAIPGSWRYDEGVLVEQYVAGPEISVDSAVYRGEALPMFLARKDVGYPPYFEEIGHIVDAADPLLTDAELAPVLAAAHRALGFTDGITHAEFKLTPDGPVVIEVNARLGGDLIPYLGMRASGIDPGLAAAAVACGLRPQLAADRSAVAGVRFFYPARDDTAIGAIRFDQAALPAETDLAVTLAAPGDVMSPPPTGTMSGRVAFATVLADTASACQTALDAAQVALIIEPA